MAFSEELYALRKQKGLSQEQLAEALDVSRQAISKWENGTAMPETETLIALSRYFGVSIDTLVGNTPKENESTAPLASTPRTTRLAGLVLLVVGVICFGLTLVFRIFNPISSGDIAQSSTVVLDGIGILMALFAIAAFFGVLLLLTSRKK